jgi:hypothetical protein
MARHKWGEIRDRLRADPERRARIEEMERSIGEEVRLADLRRARGFTQRQLAAAMGTPQPGVARLEKQADVYLSTLRSYVEAMGGRLELRAVFDDATVPIADLAEPLPAAELEAHGIVVVPPPAVAGTGTVEPPPGSAVLRAEVAAATAGSMPAAMTGGDHENTLAVRERAREFAALVARELLDAAPLREEPPPATGQVVWSETVSTEEIRDVRKEIGHGRRGSAGRVRRDPPDAERTVWAGRVGDADEEAAGSERS